MTGLFRSIIDQVAVQLQAQFIAEMKFRLLGALSYNMR